jgi:hypothetical protein
LRYSVKAFLPFVSIFVVVPLCIGQQMTPAPVESGYTFPTGHQQFHNYLDTAFGPQGFIAAAIGAGLDQSKPSPPEWDHGGQGFGERYGFRYGMVLFATTAKYSLGAAMQEDVSYHKCDCTGFFPRALHAVSSTVTARTRSGQTVLSLPALVAPYAGSFTAVKAWYPARYEPEDAFRTGSISFTFSAGANMVREFLLPRR